MDFCITFVLNVALSATGNAVSPPSSTSFKKYRTVIYLHGKKRNRVNLLILRVTLKVTRLSEAIRVEAPAAKQITPCLL